MNINDVHVPRQHVIRGAGLVLTAGALAACGDGGDKQADKPAASSEAVTTPPAEAASGGAIAKTADVPVGSGVIVDDVVVTQPTAGVFKGFSSSCTHKGCAVNKVADARSTAHATAASSTWTAPSPRARRASLWSPKPFRCRAIQSFSGDRTGQAELTPRILPSRNASTKCRWSSRTVAA